VPEQFRSSCRVASSGLITSSESKANVRSQVKMETTDVGLEGNSMCLGASSVDKICGLL